MTMLFQFTLREDAQTAEMELIAAQYRGRARVLQAKLFVQYMTFKEHAGNCREIILIIKEGLHYFCRHLPENTDCSLPL